MFTLEYKKQITNTLTNKVEKFLYKYTRNNTISGYILAMVHWLIMFLVYLYILLGDINTLFYLCCIFLLITYILHLYFSGCILIRIERKIWNTEKWWGIWTILFLFMQSIGIPITKLLTTNIYNLWTLYVVFIIIVKLYNKK